jgi:hypothetical protein
MTDRNGGLESIEGRTGTLFLVAGTLFIAFAAMWGVEAVTNRSAPKNVFGPAGFAFAFVGMLGLYPALSERSRRLAQFGAIVAIVGGAGAAANSVWYIGWWVVPAVVPDPSTSVLVGGMVGGMILGQFLGYTTFGVASLRAGVHSRTVGLLLVAVPTVLVVMIVTVATGYDSSGSATVLGSVQALIHLAIGYTLRTESIPTEHGDPSVEPTAE